MDTQGVDAQVLAAVITAVASLLVACAGLLWNSRNSKTLEAFRTDSQANLEKLKSELAASKAEKDARLDYQYEARKRLYEECEPLLFQLESAAENALHRIRSLARTARTEINDADRGRWLRREGYYALTTYYKLMAPAGLFKILQRHLTSIDLGLDPMVKVRYDLARAIYSVYLDDFELASYGSKLSYDPDHQDARARREREPAVYRRQGLMYGELERSAELMIVEDSIRGQGMLRLLSYGEFERKFGEENSQLRVELKSVRRLFRDFHPADRPILWRILVAQAHALDAFIRMNRRSPDRAFEPSPIRPIATSERAEYEWTSSSSDDSARECDLVLEAAWQYLVKEWGHLSSDPRDAV